MLTVAKITRSAAGGYAEYLDGKTRSAELGDYYLRDGDRAEAPGRWAQGAKEFGLDPEQPVTGEQLRALMDVNRPDTGGELRRVGGTGEAVAALDATFSAPKSVSAVWAIADRELRDRIERAHETAIDRALTYATRQVPMLRRRVSHDTVLHEKATGLVATSWRHTTARAVADQIPDPQLHSHVLLHAAVRRDGRLVAIDSRSWLVHQREVGAAYRTELARELADLGFAVQRSTGRGGRYFELDGVLQTLLDRWSSRHHQVQAAIHQRLTDQEQALEAVIAQGGPAASEAVEQLELLRRSGQLSPKEERWMATVTRSTKAPVTLDDLDKDWRRTALRLGASRERIEVLRHPPQAPLEPAGMGDVLEALTEFDATFPARDARAVALERSAGAPIHAALEQLRALRASDDILVLADGSGTTREHRGREHTVVAIAQRLAETRVQSLPASATAAEIHRLDRELAARGGRLSDEQRAAIERACGEHPFVVIEGHAGTGKSTALAGIARAHQACGREVIVTSTAALAAERLATELTDRGVSCAAYSTAGLHAAITSRRVELMAETTIIHDEAVLASTREQLQLLHAIESAGARLIAVGDPRQNQPVGAGGLWTRVSHTADDAGARVELTVNQRARDSGDRRDQARFRGGQAELAIRGYAARDRIHVHPDQQRVEDQALTAAHADRGAGKTTIVIAQTSNEQLDALNARAQAIRRHHGELGDDGVDVPGRPYQLHAGDQVQIRHTITHPDRGQLRNGTTAQMTGVDPRARELDLQLADGTQLHLNQQQVANADLRLSYVQHPFPAQGQTTDTAHLIVAGNATREGSYVALTRARDETHIYAADAADGPLGVDRLSELAERISRTEPDLPSIETPLEHEGAITAQTDTMLVGHDLGQTRSDLSPDQQLDTPLQAIERTNDVGDRARSTAGRVPHDISDPGALAGEQLEEAPDVAAELDLATSRRETAEPNEPSQRTWPRRPEHELDAPRQAAEQLERDETLGFEH